MKSVHKFHKKVILHLLSFALCLQTIQLLLASVAQDVQSQIHCHDQEEATVNNSISNTVLQKMHKIDVNTHTPSDSQKVQF